MRVGQARKRDATEAQIVAALERVGVEVMRLSGPGVPDLLTQWRGTWRPLEVKSRGGKLTTLQANRERFHGRAPIPVVRTIDEAFQAIGIS